MSSKKTKDKKSRPLPKPNRQIPISLVRKSVELGLNPFLQNARTYPLYGCWIMQGWRDEGITPVVVARKQENGRILFGVYMVDLYCLGIKDAFTRTDYSVNQFNRELPKLCAGTPERCSVELAHEVIYGGLEYAEKIGFQPHPDFIRLQADQVLDPPDAHPRVDHVTFGKDGKPLFVSGPYDNAIKIRSVINTLTHTCGEGKFDYLIGLDDPGGL